MLISQKDAEDKWCPFGRAQTIAEIPGVGVAMAGVNLGKLKGEGTRCMGDACMQWRWAGWRIKTFDTVAPDPDDENKIGPRLGYCGLAGKPFGAA
jgi:hypothetical protein